MQRNRESVTGVVGLLEFESGTPHSFAPSACTKENLVYDSHVRV